MIPASGSAIMQRAALVALAILAGLGLAAGPALAGVVFREAETIESVPPGVESRPVNQVRQVFAEGDDCKVLLEASSDPLIPVGAYVLASTVDAFLVDPAAQTIAPLDPTAMVPATVAPGEPAAPTRILSVALEAQLDAAGEAILGLPTRHLVYRLRYEEAGANPDGVMRRDERHEYWITPWAAGETRPVAWQKLRLAEDAGPGVERAEIRDALEPVYQGGFVLRQLIERRATSGSPATASVAVERVTREVTAFSRQALAADVFARPAAYAPTEFLAPAPETAPENANDRGDARDVKATSGAAAGSTVTGD